MKKIMIFITLVIIVFGIKYCIIGFTTDEIFRSKTDLSLGDFEVVVTTNTHGGLHGDGETYIVVKAKKEDITRIIKEKPPWSQKEWKGLPFFHIVLGSSHFDYRKGHLVIQDEWPDYSGKTIYSVKTTNLFYIARDNTKNPTPSWNWSDAEVLIVDKTSSTIWYANWDY